MSNLKAVRGGIVLLAAVPALSLGAQAVYSGQSVTSSEVVVMFQTGRSATARLPVTDPEGHAWETLTEGDLAMLAHAASLATADGAEDYSSFLLDDD